MEQNQETVEVETIEEVDNETENIAKEPESVEDSVRKAIQIEKDKSSEEETDGDKTPEVSNNGTESKTELNGQVKTEVAKKGRKKEVIPDMGIAYEAPNRLPPERKEAFKKLPRDVQKDIVDLFRNTESHFSKTQGELSAAVRESKHILEAVRPYYLSVPEFAEKGITESALVSTLIGNHQKLLNPKTSKSKLAEIAASLGHNIKFIDDNGSESEVSAGVENSPQFRALQEELNQVKSHISNQITTEKASEHISDIEVAQNEKDASGNLAWPELHSRDFIESVRPFVSAQVRNDPNLGYGEALKIAAIRYRLKNGNPSQLTQTKPRQDNNINDRAVSGARTVRGGPTPSSVRGSLFEGAKRGESMEDSVRAAIDLRRRGVI